MPISAPGLGTQWSAAAASYLTAFVTDDVIPRLNDARNNSCPILGLIPSSSDRVAGKYVVEPVMFGRNFDAFNNVRDNGQLPDPSTTQGLTYAYRTRQLFARMKIAGRLLRATNKADVRFIDVVERDFQAMSDDMAVDEARKLYSDGSGRLAEVQSVAFPNITIRLNQNMESVATCSSIPTQLSNLVVGMRICFMTAAGSHIATRRITSIVSETPGPPSSAVVAVDGVVAGIAAGQWICKMANSTAADGAGNEDSTSFRTEPMGLGGIFSDDGVLDGNGVSVLNAGTLSYTGTEDFSGVVPANFQGIPVAGNSWNRAIVMTGGGVLRPVNEALLTLALSKVERQNNGMVDFMLSDYGPRDAYGIGMMGQKQYHNTLELRGGWSVLDFNGRPWYVDRNCPNNRVFLMGLEAGGFTQHVNTEFQPLNPFGEHWYRLPDDDQYQAAWVMDYTTGVGIRERVGGLLTDIISAAA